MNLKDMLEARKGGQDHDPIKAFARGHLSLTMSILARWPEIEPKQKSEHVGVWAEQITKHYQPVIEKWFYGENTPDLRMAFYKETLEEAVAHLLGDDARDPGERASLEASKMLSRAKNILEIVAKEFDPDLIDQLSAPSKPTWGQHGAHFLAYRL
ncbi:hypothetical protein [Algihabitans albus]|uniref:hypothetical protein n=1 Tax=Algihabitans albus TaxID=2164067 RepID=UPI000E5CD53A|nr:hypothetical protein [Algihabitans albus]